VHRISANPRTKRCPCGTFSGCRSLRSQHKRRTPAVHWVGKLFVGDPSLCKHRLCDHEAVVIILERLVRGKFDDSRYRDCAASAKSRLKRFVVPFVAKQSQNRQPKLRLHVQRINAPVGLLLETSTTADTLVMPSEAATRSPLDLAFRLPIRVTLDGIRRDRVAMWDPKTPYASQCDSRGSPIVPSRTNASNRPWPLRLTRGRSKSIGTLTLNIARAIASASSDAGWHAKTNNYDRSREFARQRKNSFVDADFAISRTTALTDQPSR